MSHPTFTFTIGTMSDGSRWGFGATPEAAMASSREILEDLWRDEEEDRDGLLKDGLADLEVAKISISGIPPERIAHVVRSLLDMDSSSVDEVLQIKAWVEGVLDGTPGGGPGR